MGFSNGESPLITINLLGFRLDQTGLATYCISTICGYHTLIPSVATLVLFVYRFQHFQNAVYTVDSTAIDLVT